MPEEPTHEDETKPPSTAARIRALDKAVCEQLAAARHRTHVANSVGRQALRWLKYAGFKQNVEQGPSQEEKRLNDASNCLGMLIDILSANTAAETPEDGPLVIPGDNGSTLRVEESDGVVTLAVAGLSDKTKLYSISLKGTVYENSTNRWGKKYPEPVYEGVSLWGDLQHFALESDPMSGFDE